MKIYPQKYDELNINRNDKQLMALLKSAYKEDDAEFLLCCNPTKTLDGIVHIFICSKGVLFISIKNGISEKNDVLSSVFTRMANTFEANTIIADRFIHQRSLVKSGKVVFPYKIITFFPDAEKIDVRNMPEIDMVSKFLDENCLFKDFWSIGLKQKSFLIDNFFGNNCSDCITESMIPDIVNRVAPEYTIPELKAAIKAPNYSKQKSTKILDSALEKEERASIAYMLDDTQINYINKIKKGDQLIMACAGSGKSVILISKCFKVAALNPEKRFLITGYNRNLMSYFRWLIDSAGFATTNVECLTFDKLCVKLLQDNEVIVPRIINNDYSRVRDLVIKCISNGKIKNRYYGVFIDEVQMFEPEWYKICYQLLENKSSDEHFFVICGDKSQSVKKSIKSGNAPWQGHGEEYPNFRGKSFPIEINYRNSIQINNYIRRFTDYALKFAEKLNISINQDADIFLRGKAFREGIDLNLVEVNRQYRSSESEAIIVLNQIVDIHDNYNVPYDSIAVICYNRKYGYIKGWTEKHYEPIKYLKEYLDEANIRYSLLNSTESEYAVSYSQIEGVPIVTMESSLGLDFRAVVICGLQPLGLHDKTKSIEYLSEHSEDEEVINSYNKNINILYMACARAKDILRIVMTENEEESIYIKMLKEAFEEGV